MRLTVECRDLVFRMLRNLKARRFLRSKLAARVVACVLTLSLLGGGLVALIRNVDEKAPTAFNNVANSAGDENFRPISPYVPGGRFGAVHY